MTTEFYDWLLMMPCEPTSPEVVTSHRGHHVRFSWCGSAIMISISDISSTAFDADKVRVEGQKWIDDEIDFLEQNQPTSPG